MTLQMDMPKKCKAVTCGLWSGHCKSNHGRSREREGERKREAAKCKWNSALTVRSLSPLSLPLCLFWLTNVPATVTRCAWSWARTTRATVLPACECVCPPLTQSARLSVCLCACPSLSVPPVCVRYIFKPTTKRKRIDNEGNGLKPWFIVYGFSI